MKKYVWLLLCIGGLSMQHALKAVEKDESKKVSEKALLERIERDLLFPAKQAIKNAKGLKKIGAKAAQAEAILPEVKRQIDGFIEFLREGKRLPPAEEESLFPDCYCDATMKDIYTDRPQYYTEIILRKFSVQLEKLLSNILHSFKLSSEEEEDAPKLKDVLNKLIQANIDPVITNIQNNLAQFQSHKTGILSRLEDVGTPGKVVAKGVRGYLTYGKTVGGLLTDPHRRVGGIVWRQTAGPRRQVAEQVKRGFASAKQKAAVAASGIEQWWRNRSQNKGIIEEGIPNLEYSN